jgi:cytochrome b561
MGDRIAAAVTAQTTAVRYDSVTIFMHWFVAMIVFLQWPIAHAIDLFPKGAERIGARSVHIVLGITLAILLMARVIWRARYGTRLSPARRDLFSFGAKVVHLLLYVLLAASVILGLATTMVRGDSIFGVFHVPLLGSYDADVRHRLANEVAGLHSLAANALLILAGLHASAALIHHFWLGDDVLKRMTPTL